MTTREPSSAQSSSTSRWRADGQSRGAGGPSPVPIRNLRLSPSAIAMYETCAKRFYLHHVLRKQTPWQADAPTMMLGNCIHRALDRFYGLQELTQRTHENLHKTFYDAWSRYPHRDRIFLDAREEAEWGRRGLNLLSDYAERFDLFVKPLRREKWMEVKVPKLGIHLRGKVDRVDVGPLGLEIIDYKTGAHQLDADELRDDISALAYVVMVATTEKRPVSQVSHLYLPSGDLVTHQIEPEDTATLTREVARRHYEAQNALQYPARPGLHCGFCPYHDCTERSQTLLSDLKYSPDLPF